MISPQRLKTPATVTLKVKDMALRDALQWLCKATGSSVRYVDQALFIDVGPAPKAP